MRGEEGRVRRRVLIVDDDKDGREAMRALLEMWDFEVDVAGDGESGIELTVDRQPEAVLIDIGMPRMNGYEVAQRIRAAADGAGPFLIAFTGWARLEDRQHAQDAGFDAYVLKPADPDELQALLAEAPPPGRPDIGRKFLTPGERRA